MKAFLQVSSHHRNKVDDVKMTQVAKLLKALSMKNHKSYALAQLAASAQSDTFAKVRGAQGLERMGGVERTRDEGRRLLKQLKGKTRAVSKVPGATRLFCSGMLALLWGGATDTSSSLV